MVTQVPHQRVQALDVLLLRPDMHHIARQPISLERADVVLADRELGMSFSELGAGHADEWSVDGCGDGEPCAAGYAAGGAVGAGPPEGDPFDVAACESELLVVAHDSRIKEGATRGDGVVGMQTDFLGEDKVWPLTADGNGWRGIILPRTPPYGRCACPTLQADL